MASHDQMAKWRREMRNAEAEAEARRAKRVELKLAGEYMWGTVVAEAGDTLTVKLDDSGSIITTTADRDCGGDYLNGAVR